MLTINAKVHRPKGINDLSPKLGQESTLSFYFKVLSFQMDNSLQHQIHLDTPEKCRFGKVINSVSCQVSGCNLNLLAIRKLDENG